jgi:hypothetical protein
MRQTRKILDPHDDDGNQTGGFGGQTFGKAKWPEMDDIKKDVAKVDPSMLSRKAA